MPKRKDSQGTINSDGHFNHFLYCNILCTYKKGNKEQE